MLDGLSGLQFFLGVFGGTISAILTLLIFHYFLSPSVRFSEKIKAKQAISFNRMNYSIRIRKSGFFDLIDTRIHCRLAMRDVHKKGDTLWTFFDIPTTFSNSIVSKTGYRIVHLKIHESIIKDLRSRRPKVASIVAQIRPDMGYRLEDFFMAYEDVYVRVYVIGHDRFTGVKKLYESKKYYFHDVRDGEWVQNSLVLEWR